jgi:hypothetical protein
MEVYIRIPVCYEGEKRKMTEQNNVGHLLQPTKGHSEKAGTLGGYAQYRKRYM